jgi:hypothetical protein
MVLYADEAWHDAKCVLLHGKRLARSELAAVTRRELNKGVSAMWCLCKLLCVCLWDEVLMYSLAAMCRICYRGGF